jgi:hypothetical protein
MPSLPPQLDGFRASTPVRRFREFRWTRPFWAALLIGVAAAEQAVLPVGPTDALIKAGSSAFLGMICAGALALMALVILFLPSQRVLAGLIAVGVSLGSFPLSNLGGFVVGMLLGILGGSMAVGWVPDKAAMRKSAGRRRRMGRSFRRKEVTGEAS